MKALALAFVLLAGIPESAWIPAEITPGKQPVRIIVTKTGWRGGPSTLVLEDRAEVARLYDLMAGNDRLGWTCGYHWNVQFQYAGGASESIDINERCETFRREPEKTWRELSRVLKEAREHPTHHAIVVTRVKPGTLPDFARFGVVATRRSYVLVISKQPWTAERIDALRDACGGLAKVHPIREYDTGN